MEDQREDWDNESRRVRNPIADLWRLGEVQRWQIVRLEKSQSVAEHSFMVALLSARLAEAIGISVGETMMFAMMHDAEEAWTGDIPAPMKKFLDSSAVPVEPMLGDMQKWTEDQGIVKGTVKMADLACDVIFLKKYGTGSHARQVRTEITVRLDDHMDVLEREYPARDWKAAWAEVAEMYAAETHLDDYIGKGV